MTQYVYFFGAGKADGNKDMKDLLGGKGRAGRETKRWPSRPPGFTVPRRRATSTRRRVAPCRRNDQQIERR